MSDLVDKIRAEDELYWAEEREREARQETERAYEAQRLERAELREIVAELYGDRREAEEEVRKLRGILGKAVGWMRRARACDCNWMLNVELRRSADEEIIPALARLEERGDE